MATKLAKKKSSAPKRVDSASLFAPTDTATTVSKSGGSAEPSASTSGVDPTTEMEASDFTTVPTQGKSKTSADFNGGGGGGFSGGGASGGWAEPETDATARVQHDFRKRSKDNDQNKGEPSVFNLIAVGWEAKDHLDEAFVAHLERLKAEFENFDEAKVRELALGAALKLLARFVPGVGIALLIKDFAEMGIAAAGVIEDAVSADTSEKRRIAGKILAGVLVAAAVGFAIGKLVRAVQRRHWHKGTFPSKKKTVKYHVDKHGKGRSATEYTKDGMDFYQQNRHLGKTVKLKDGTLGIKIQKKVVDSVTGRTKTVGGYWTQNGKMVTFWD